MFAAGYLVADALTGVVHWFCDTFFEETTPVLGRGLIAPFREHHRDPLLMTRHGFLELTGSSFRGPRTVAGDSTSGSWTGSRLGWMAFVLGLSRVAERPPISCTAGRTIRIPLLSPGPCTASALCSLQHATPTTTRLHMRAAYCVTSGWLNPLFERVARLDACRNGANRDRATCQSRQSRLIGQKVCGIESAGTGFAFDTVALGAIVLPVRTPSQTADRSTASGPRSSYRSPRVPGVVPVMKPWRHNPRLKAGQIETHIRVNDDSEKRNEDQYKASAR